MPTWAPTKVRINAPYGVISTRPLHVLVFLVPLMILYEIGSIMYLAGPARGADTIGARGILGSFFDLFGAASLHLPPIALAAVLLVWHLFIHDPWRVRPRVIAGMALESVIWSIPLLVFSLLLARGGQPAAAMHAQLGTLPWQAKLSISLGAGIYEELLFRLILISFIHFLLVDLFRLSDAVGFVVAGVLSALAFAWYHDLTGATGQLDLRLVTFYCVAGLYFGVIFIARGFGIVVATHALYDIVALFLFFGRT